jgi:glycosyltransferase involved in cell wall biosynthesis
MHKAPRLLLINYEYPPLGGGAGTATAGLARAFTDLGCDVVVLTSRVRGLPARESSNGFTIIRVPVLRRRVDRCTPVEMLIFLVSACIGGLRLTRRWRADMTIAFFGIPSGPVALLLRTVRGIPYIVSLRGGDVPGFEWAAISRIYHAFTRPVLRFIWRRARSVVANSNGLAELARKTTPERPIAVAPNGVELPPSAPAPTRVDGRPLRLLTMGRLTSQKGIDILFRALTQLRDIPVQLDIAGDGPERTDLEQMAQALGVAEQVRFLGWVSREQLPQVFGAADVFVLASRAEGMPNVVLEAMAYARPVICTRVAGCEELVDDRLTGLKVAVEDVDQLAAALRELLSDTALRARIGAAARARVERDFTWTATARIYLQQAGVGEASTALHTANAEARA